MEAATAPPADHGPDDVRTVARPAAPAPGQDRDRSPATPDGPTDHPEQIALPLDLPASSVLARDDIAAAPSGPTTAERSASGSPGDPASAAARVEDARADGHDQPIGFALTARARRAVAPGTLPPLSVVAPGADGPRTRDTGALDEADDTRPARARALRRAGVPIGAIGRQVGADPLAVAAWVGEVGPAVRPAREAGPRTASTGGDASERTGAPPAVVDDEEAVAARLARAAAAETARARLGADPEFGIAIGLLAATAATDLHAVTITAAQPRQVAPILRLLAREDPEVPIVVRVIARVGPELAGDLVRHRVAGELGVAPAQVSWTRWRSAPEPDAVQLLVRVADPSLAATVAGWIDVALEPRAEALGLAF